MEYVTLEMLYWLNEHGIRFVVEDGQITDVEQDS
jgi:hypothetical protein